MRSFIELIDPRMKLHPGAVYLHEKKINTISQHSQQTNLYITGSLDRSAKLWDLRKVKFHQRHDFDAPLCTSALIETVPHALSVNSASFSPSGNHMVTVCMDNHINVYETKACFKQLHRIPHDNKTGRWVTKFTTTWDPKAPEGHFVIGSKLQPRCIEIYSVNQKKPLYRLEQHDLFQSIHSANAFHPTLNMIASANSSGRVCLWK